MTDLPPSTERPIPPVRGTRDRLPDELEILDGLEQLLLARFRAAGYRPRVLEEIAGFNRRVREEAARGAAPGEAVGSGARAGRAPVGAGA